MGEFMLPAHMRAVALLAAMMAIPAMLFGCNARADDPNRHRQIESAVQQVMCAKTEDDRSTAVLLLADAVEAYRGVDRDDTGAAAVEAVMDSFKERGCRPASGQSGVKG